ncbi:unnamed protein product [Amoebophrya sp. A120]|nr:unnamed protein product [Amoebophrya sp. A120]|eukprot:GSA120T00018507001.1
MGGSKKKVGKERLDKYYQLAKDQGYRARSAFKLVQLAKKVDFLSDARVCVDLCGAPGGWSQVAAKNMPRNSKILCLDLCPIKPIPGVTGIQCDITTPKCRQLIKKELEGRSADVVLNDGAPNVGSSWSHDAYVQNELVLHATKLAAEILRPGGTFVTKVFRSQDYTSLLWVFEQLFGKVEATKPQASRNVSAEIFVLCQNYKAVKTDPKFFDPRWVFMEAVDSEAKEKKSQASLMDLLKYQAKKHRGGYEPGDDMRTCSLMDFVKNQSPALILTTHHKLLYRDDESLTISDELREYCDDLKVLGKRELSMLLKWRMLTRRNYEKEKKTSIDKVDKEEKSDDESGSEKEADAEEKQAEPATGSTKKVKFENADEELEAMIKQVKQEEKREAKKARELKKKFEWRKKMSMGMRYSGITHDAELFQQAPKNFGDFENGAGGQMDSDDEEKMNEAEAAAQELETAEDRKETTATSKNTNDSDSDEEDSDDPEIAELNRLADMEAEQILAMREKKSKLSQAAKGRELKQKKETRRQQKYREWAGEMNHFNHEIDEEAAKQHQEREQFDSDDDDDSEDDEEDAAGDAAAANQKPKLTDELDSDGEEEEAMISTAAEDDAMDLSDDEAMSTADAADEERGTMSTKDKVRAERWFSQDLFSSLQKRLATAGTTASASVAAAAGKKAKQSAASSSSKSTAGRENQNQSKAILTSRNESDSDADNSGDEQSIKALSDDELPHIPLCDKKKRQLKKRKEKEREARKAAQNIGGSLTGKGKRKSGIVGPDGEEVVDEDESAVAASSLDDKTQFDVVERRLDEEMDNILLPGQESLRGKAADVPDHLKAPTDKKELAAVQALGSMMIRKKSRMALLDSAYNRYAWDDEGLDLPEWFVEDEEKYNKPELPVTKELMDQYRAKLKEINQRPIRKVAEANARNKKRLQQRMDKVRKQAKQLAADTEMSAGAKARNMEKMLRKAQKEGSKKQAYMAIRKAGGSRNVTQGKPTKGAKSKVVDKRMKTDKRGQKKAEKKAKKGKHKGNRGRAPKQKGGAKKKGGKKK